MNEQILDGESNSVTAARQGGRDDVRPTFDLRVRLDAPAKPAYGQSCNGCGVCCALEPCSIARDYIPNIVEGPCPALTYDGCRFVCGMTREPGKYMELPNDWADPFLGSMFAEALGIGRGCDASD